MAHLKKRLTFIVFKSPKNDDRSFVLNHKICDIESLAVIIFFMIKYSRYNDRDNMVKA